MENQGDQEVSQDDKSLAKGIRYHVMLTRLEQLRTLEKALPAVEKTRYLDWRIGLAAAAVLVIGVAAIFMLGGNSDAKLYAANFEPYPNVFDPTQRGDSQPDKR